MRCEDRTVQAFVNTLPSEAQPGPCEAWGFGDSPAMADALGRLVLEGPKRATAGLLESYRHEGEALPRVGQHSIILDGSGAPLCVIETSGVKVKPFH